MKAELCAAEAASSIAEVLGNTFDGLLAPEAEGQSDLGCTVHGRPSVSLNRGSFKTFADRLRESDGSVGSIPIDSAIHSRP